MHGTIILGPNMKDPYLAIMMLIIGIWATGYLIMLSLAFLWASVTWERGRLWWGLKRGLSHALLWGLSGILWVLCAPSLIGNKPLWAHAIVLITIVISETAATYLLGRFLLPRFVLAYLKTGERSC